MKVFSLFVLLGLGLGQPLLAQVVNDESEGQAAVWSYPIDLVDKAAGRIVIGDRQFFYKRPVRVRSQSGKSLPVTVLGKGVRVSVVPLIRNNTSYINEIVVLGR